MPHDPFTLRYEASYVGYTLRRDFTEKGYHCDDTIILGEQQVEAVLAVADRAAFIEHEQNPETVNAKALLNDDGVMLRRYLGV